MKVKFVGVEDGEKEPGSRRGNLVKWPRAAGDFSDF
jgi:hypothetical protein